MANADNPDNQNAQNKEKEQIEKENNNDKMPNKAFYKNSLTYQRLW